jgi:hypothetical protein
MSPLRSRAGTRIHSLRTLETDLCSTAQISVRIRTCASSYLGWKDAIPEMIMNNACIDLDGSSINTVSPAISAQPWRIKALDPL